MTKAPAQIPVKGEGFQYGGFKTIHIGKRKFPAAIVARLPEILADLRFARKTIKRMKRETNEFDEGRAVANKALKRLNASMTRYR